MKRELLLAAVVMAGAVSMAIAQTGPAQGGPGGAAVGADVKREMTDVPVKRVVLFSSGVGFFQHSGRVSGNAATELRFKTEQINDILKSLVVADASAGTVKSITYGSQNPVTRTLKSFQIDISTNPTLAGILNQIRGSKVALTLPDQKVEGTILGVEEKERPTGKPGEEKVVKVSYVNVISATGIQSVDLDQVKRLEIQDAALQKELDEALTALTQARDKDKKPVVVNFDGTGDRMVTIAYLVETPVWKTSYRLIMPDASSKDNSTLVGWAIVENQTDNDWKDVTLDLVGGRPISFIQDLYQPLYVPRPRVAPKTYASLTPQTYEDGIDRSVAEAAPAFPPGRGAGPVGGAGGGRGGRGGGGGGGAGGGGFGGGGAAPTLAPAAAAARDALAKEEAPMDFAQSVQSIADASKIGEMFQYSVKGVTLPRQRSSMIPIVTSSVPFDRVSIYNRSVLAANPLLGVRLKNQTANYLLAGPVAVLDKVKKADGTLVESYAGDAMIDDVPPGQERLISYAVDQELRVDASKRDPRVSLSTGSIIKGVLQLKYIDAITQEYLLENKGDQTKQVLIEHPVQVSYDLKEPAKALEKTEKVYRFEVPVAAKKTIVFPVREEKVRLERVAILNVDVGTLEFYRSSKEIPARVKEVLKAAGDKRKAVADVERKLSLRQSERSQILQEQGNIRENIKVLPQNTPSYQNSITDLTTKDTELKSADKDIKDLQTAAEKARGDLEAYLSDMNVEG